MTAPAIDCGALCDSFVNNICRRPGARDAVAAIELLITHYGEVSARPRSDEPFAAMAGVSAYPRTYVVDASSHPRDRFVSRRPRKPRDRPGATAGTAVTEQRSAWRTSPLTGL